MNPLQWLLLGAILGLGGPVLSAFWRADKAGVPNLMHGIVTHMVLLLLALIGFIGSHVFVALFFAEAQA